ncbi:MAG: extracellular solute-binding protein, partial [Acetobacteraceae bacterium]
EDHVMTDRGISRRTLLGTAAVGTAAVGTAALSTAAAFVKEAAAATAPSLPKHPVAINIVDVAGNLALTRPAFEAYVRQKPHLVSHISYNQAPAPELPGKLKAEESAGRLDIDLVLTGIDALSGGLSQGIWLELLPAYAAALPDPEKVYLPGALKMQGIASGHGLCVTFCPAGPLLEYNPAKVSDPPTSPAELLAWAKAHPKRFIYARPANSGPGRIFMMGLPYLLGDTDPMDPAKGWSKTWAYLAELGKTIEYYPAGTAVTMREFGSGLRDITPTQLGWDINPRALGVVPKSYKVSVFKGFKMILDAHYMCVPKGIAPDKLAVLLDLMSFMLEPAQQAVTWDAGYFYPGPAVKNVPLSMAPKKSQEIMQEFGRPFYPKLIEETPQVLPLPAERLVYAFGRWDREIGKITAG